MVNSFPYVFFLFTFEVYFAKTSFFKNPKLIFEPEIASDVCVHSGHCLALVEEQAAGVDENLSRPKHHTYLDWKI